MSMATSYILPGAIMGVTSDRPLCSMVTVCATVPSFSIWSVYVPGIESRVYLGETRCSSIET